MTIPNHYARLGVAEDATHEEIKAAFRKASMKAHPDREGGSEQAQAAVNEAYAVLGDPERRKHYDETGESKLLTPEEQQAVVMLASLFEAALDDDTATDMVAWCRREACERISMATAEIKRGEGMIRTLRLRRETVRAKGERENVLHGLVDSRINNLRDTIETNKGMIRRAGLALKMLDDYEFAPLAPTFRPGFDVRLQGAEEVKKLATHPLFRYP